MDKRKCSKCKVSRPVSDYIFRDKTANKLMSQCQPCRRASRTLWGKTPIGEALVRYQLRKQYIKRFNDQDRKENMYEKNKEYASGWRGKYSAKRAVKKWAEKNRKKSRAHWAIKSAIKSGKIKKHPCETCGETKRVHGHHDDYSKPLNVIWLCPKHHAARHLELKNG